MTDSTEQTQTQTQTPVPLVPYGISTLLRQPSWDIYDSTKIKAFMECPRKYFYEYILGWQSEEPNWHLKFGEAVHVALESLLLSDYSDSAVFTAHGLFLSCLRQEFPNGDLDSLHEPKTPMQFLRLLTEYRNLYAESYKKMEVLYTEVSGIVPVDADTVLHFRLDAVCRDDRGIFCLEHKTASQQSRVWLDQWALDVQVGTYSHVLHCLFDNTPHDQIYGVVIDGLFFYKEPKRSTTDPKVPFMQVPCRKTNESLAVWHSTVLYWLGLLKEEMSYLEESTPEDTVLGAFPQNPQSCTKWFGCPFLDFCRSWSNPLKRCQTPPPGYKVSWWDPRNQDKTAKHVVNLSV